MDVQLSTEWEDTNVKPPKISMPPKSHVILIVLTLGVLVSLISIPIMVHSIRSQRAIINSLVVKTPDADGDKTKELNIDLQLEDMKKQIANLTTKNPDPDKEKIKEMEVALQMEEMRKQIANITTKARDTEEKKTKELEEMRKQLANLTTEARDAEEKKTKELEKMRKQLANLTTENTLLTMGRPGNDTTGAMVTYNHWGLASCPSTAELVYKGIMSGGVEAYPGGGSNYLCLPDVPNYMFKVTRVEDYRAPIGATEFRMGGPTVKSFTPMAHLHGGDPPCAVCLAKRSTMIVMPGKGTCPSGWTFEYRGYIMAARSDRHRTEFVCVDVNSVVREGTAHVETSYSQILIAETRCSEGGTHGGLPCPPYENGSELPCAVCTK